MAPPGHGDRPLLELSVVFFDLEKVHSIVVRGGYVFFLCVCVHTFNTQIFFNRKENPKRTFASMFNKG